MRIFRSLPKAADGQYVSADQFNRLVDAVEKLSSLTSSDDLAITSLGNVLSVSNNRPDSWDAQILSGPAITPDGCMGYDWIEVMKVGCSWSPFADSRSGSVAAGSGSIAPGSGPILTGGQYAVEINGNEDVVIGSIVKMWPSADAKSTEFQSFLGTGSGMGSGGNIVRILKCVMLVPVGTGSGIASGIASGVTPP